MKKAIYILFVFIFTFVFVSCEPQKTMPKWYSKEVAGEFVSSKMDGTEFISNDLLGKQIIIELTSPLYFPVGPETNLIYYLDYLSQYGNLSEEGRYFWITVYTDLHTWDTIPEKNVRVQGIVYNIKRSGLYPMEVIISPAIVLD